MAKLTRTSIEARIAGVNAKMALANGGVVRVYTGPRPATVEDPATGTLLSTGQLQATAFDGAVQDGTDVVADAKPIADDPAIAADGIAGWFRVYKADGTTGVFDGTCGTSNANMLFNQTSLVAGIRLTYTSLTYKEPQDIVG